MAKRRIISALVFGYCLFFVSAYFFFRDGGYLQVHFLDVGQGDAVYIRTPEGGDILIDGGPSRSVLQKISEAMPVYDRSIDIVVATHPDADHIGGLPHILNLYDVSLIMVSGAESENAIDDEIERIVKEKNIPMITARRGMSVDFGDGAYLYIYHPGENPAEFTDTNSASVTARLNYGSTSVMLTGDLPMKLEDRLAASDGGSLRSDILKAGHHGSRTSSGERFVEAVAPIYAVISAGKKNRYGHPHPEVLEIFRKRGVEVLRTGEGNVVFISDGKRIFPKIKQAVQAVQDGRDKTR